jgi:hypothetical protein
MNGRTSAITRGQLKRADEPGAAPGRRSDAVVSRSDSRGHLLWNRAGLRAIIAAIHGRPPHDVGLP